MTMTTDQPDTPTKPNPQLNPLLKLALDLGPLALFFAIYAKYDIFPATAAFMAAAVAAVLTTYAMIRRWPVMPVVTAVVVVVMGGLTLWLHDQTFIQLKPTIIYALFGGILLGGYVFKKSVLEIVFDAVFPLTHEGWRKLTLRWALFFLAMALLNEAVRLGYLQPLADLGATAGILPKIDTQSFDFWLKFKVFGFAPLFFLFSMLQLPLMMRYAVEDPASAESSSGS
jgi:intracellular septation protein